MSLTSSLTSRQAKDCIAFVSKELPSLNLRTGFISTETFLSHCYSLASQLPEKSHIINLCGNRYLFLVSLCAGVLRKQINLLPPNKNLATQESLSGRYDDAYILHDGVSVHDDLYSMNIEGLVLSENFFNWSSDEIEHIPLDQIALISFTSGSTGNSKPNIKTWQTLLESTKTNRQYMLPEKDKTFHILATVPGQHMWGLETSVLIPLFTPACLVDSKPLFPADIQHALSSIPEPRALVTTPVHLRALVNSHFEFSKLDYILCATAPLNQTLAKQSEVKFEAKLHEVYGCNEIGSMAIRKTVTESTWLKFDSICFQQEADKIIASTSYLPEPIEMSDQIELLKNDYFNLLGRSSDMVNIAGKRGSLTEINSILLQYEGVEDGVVIFPEQGQVVPRLVAIVVLKGDATKNELKQHFRKYLDDIFVPRRIFQVNGLPREENGKLPQKFLDQLYQKLINKSDD